MMSDRLVKNKVSLEEVLRLKRAERPDPTFWEQFEQQLRAKQLAAIVERRPWWQFDLSRLSAGVSKLRLPLGATAVIALSLVTVREYRSSDVASAVKPQADEVAGVPVNDVSPVGVSEVAATEEVLVRAAGSSSAPAVASATGVSESAPVATVASNDHRADSPLLPWMGDIGSSSSTLIASESTSTGAAFADLRSSALVLDESIGHADELTGLGRATAKRDLVEPLTQVTAPTESRRARLAALVAPASLKNASAKAAPERVRDRMISRLSEDELYSSVSRLGVAKGGLSLNF